MRNLTLARSSIYLGALFLLTHCSDTGSVDNRQRSTGGDVGLQASGGNGVENMTSVGGSLTNAGGSNSGGNPAANAGGQGTGTGAVSTSGGANVGGQSTGSGGNDNPSAGGNQTNDNTGGDQQGTGGGPDIDEGGKGIAALGERTEVAQDYLRLGEIRILNNNWGSEDLGCNDSSMSVFVDDVGKFGWDFYRGDCASNGDPNAVPVIGPDSSKPDFPQVEFGIHPFGIADELVTSPEFSSTTLLPLQISQITSASVTLDDLNIALGGESSWNLTMEFWLSEGDPRQPSGSVKVDTEVMAWWGWNNGRWPCNSSPDTVQAGQTYTLCHQDDQWANGQWRYYQFRAGDGSDGNISRNFSGTIDVGAFLDYLVNNKGYSQDLWLTRMEVGSEIDDMTDGTVSMNGITFEVNGESRAAEIAP